MTARSSFDAVLFDCDGVLVDSEALGLDASADYLRGHGLDWSTADLVRIFTGLRDDVFAERLTAAYREKHAADPADGFFQGLVDARRSLAHLLTEVAGARAAIEATPVAKAVASSSRAAVLEKKLKRTELWALFEPHVYSAEVVDHGKPAPDIFLHAAEMLDADPARCLVLEDSVNGVKAGVAAGMTVWGFTGGGHCFDGHGERLIDAGAERVSASFDDYRNALGLGG